MTAVDNLSRLQREWGLKFQLAAQSLLEEMGYEVIKAQHRPEPKGLKFWTTRQLRHLKKDSYLWNYADYVVRAGNALFAVEVKTQGYIPRAKNDGGHPYTPETISFTPEQKRRYATAKVTVLVLLILYRWGGMFEKFSPGRLPASLRFEYSETKTHALEIKGCWVYAEEPDIWELGPLYYKVVPVSQFKFPDDSDSGLIHDKFKGTKMLTSRETYNLLQKNDAF